MAAKPLHELTASEVAALTRSGELSVEQYATALLDRVKQRDGAVHAWAYLDPELVLRSARELDAVPADQRGPLHGVAVGVKDVIYTRDMPTQHFSPIYKDDHPAVDAAVVCTLRSAGALIFGKTHTTEFAACAIGPPACNPHDPTRTPGGSSSGSGAAVGDCQVPLALGTQTGGSTVRPGSFNGIFAFKPTWNAVSREGLKMYSATCDTVGFYSRSAQDFELLCDVFQIHDDVPPPETPLSLQGARIAFVQTHVWPKGEPDLANVWQEARDRLALSGATVVDLDLPEFADMTTWHRNVLHMEGQAAFLNEYRKRPELLDPWVVKHVANEGGTTRRELLESYDNIARLRPVFDALAADYDAIITPSAAGEAPVAEPPARLTGTGAFCVMWTALHAPVVNVPGLTGSHGLPIGLSVVGGRYTERALLRAVKSVAAALQE